jgi:AcrR family transcriptional regulator
MWHAHQVPAASDHTVIALPALVAGLPDPPAPHLDPFLDAAARCFARHGVRRTSVQDVARELRVNRATVYRQVGSVDQQARLLLSREIHRLLAYLPRHLPAEPGPHAAVDLVAATIEYAHAHPVVAKVLADEPELIGPFLVADLRDILGRIAAGVTPLLRAAMDAGWLAHRDPAAIAEWIVRLGVTLIVAPPPGDLRDFLAEVLVPALTPAPTP